MSDWHPFGYEGKPGSCLWCGRVLRHKTYQLEPDEDIAGWPGFELTGKTKTGPWGTPLRIIRALKPGGYSDGFFCGLRCAYKFGVRMAELGYRLRPDK